MFVEAMDFLWCVMWDGSELDGSGGVLDWCGLSLNGSDDGLDVLGCGLGLISSETGLKQIITSMGCWICMFLVAMGFIWYGGSELDGSGGVLDLV